MEIKRQQKERRDEFKAKNLKGKVTFATSTPPASSSNDSNASTNPQKSAGGQK